MRFGFSELGTTVLGPTVIAVAPLTGGAVIPCIVVGFCISIGSFWRHKQQELSFEQRRAVKAALQTAREFLVAAGAQGVRANVMIRAKEPSGEVLRMEYWTNGYHPDERSTTFPAGTGAAGTAWARQCSSLAVAKGEMNRAAEQLGQFGVHVTELVPGLLVGESISTVLSIPLTDAGDHVLGVANFDDEHTWSESPFCKVVYIRAGEQLASSIARILTEGT